MTNEQRIKNLEVPTHPVDVVMDTDAYNEIDDQFAIAYLLSCKRKLTTKAFYAAPFDNENSTGPADGMEKSYEEIYPADVVDTTAAGDTFTGYFVAGIAAGEDYASILRTATAASSIAVSRAGAAPSIPCKQEVLAHFSLT